MSGRTTQKATTFPNIDAYIATFPPATQAVLQRVRATIQNALPEAQETISYNMPGFKINGVVANFAAWKNHIGLYPGVIGIEEFKDAVAAYEGEKGSLRFPLSEPMPLDLIARVVQYHAATDKADAQAKAEAKEEAKAARKSRNKE